VQVIQDAVDNTLVFDASNYPDSATATSANLDIDVKHAFEALGPGHCRMALDG